jgi:exopolysaccharide biosynthesis polyprenyl glycosylphosphotransferase
MNAATNEPLATSLDVTPDSFASPYLQPDVARAQARKWRSAYRWRVLIVDAVILAAVVILAEYLGTTFYFHHFATFTQATVFSVAAFVVWLTALAYVDSRDLSLVGLQAEEYRRVGEATGWTFALMAGFEIFLDMPISRIQFGVTFGLGLIGLIAGRHLLRADVRRRRKQGKYISRVVALGDVDAARTLCEYFARSPGSGYQVVGLCIPDNDEALGTTVSMPTGDVPILGYREDGEIEGAVQSAGADTLAAVYSENLGPEQVKFLAWRMQAINTELIIVPGLTEVAAHRLQLRPLENLPLFVIDAPTHDATSMITKRILDLVLGTIGVLVALPVIALAGLAIKLDDRGPVFYRQQRVGMDGKPFKIVKLRSMYVDTDKTPQSAQHRHGSMFHKRTSDSCVTRVGKFIRATSIDELPQLFNVLGGSMSLVGPRPLAVGEAGSDTAFIEHREHVKPGMTGLWQVSGRSELEDKDRVRLDVSYAGNWSVVGDLVIIWRTVGAVLKRKGAY